MDEKQLAEQISAKVNELLAKSKDGLIAKEAFDTEVKAIKDSITELKGLDKSVALQGQVDQLTKDLAAIKLAPKEEVKSFAVELKGHLNKEIAALQLLKAKGGNPVNIELKSFLESANASVTTGSLLPTPEFEAGISKAPDRQPFLMDIITTGFANSLSIYWTQRKTRTDNQGWVTEGTSTKIGGGSVAQSVLGYETKTATMQNLLAFIKVSNNSIDDIDWLLSEVQTELFTLMALKLDADILGGTIALNGYDGILTKATAFNAAGDTLPAGITPNNFDALSFAINQILVANHQPNYIIMHPSDVRDMKLTRDAVGTYLLPPTMATGMNVSVDGVRIIANTGMTKGSYLVGDFRKAKFWLRKGMDLKIWEQNEDDAIEGLKTLTLYMRGTLVIKDADTTAFVTDTFDLTKVDITKV